MDTRQSLSRRSWVVSALMLGTAAWAQTPPAQTPPAQTPPAQAYPARPIRLMVGFAPGGGTDVTARMFAQKLAILLGQPVVVENRPGAAGTIAAELVAKSEPDGYRLLMIASGTHANATLSTKPPFNIQRDFTPIAFVTVAPLVLVVNPELPARNVKELIEVARTQPGGLSFGSDGIGAISHLAGELFNQMAKVKMVHVPFKGNSEAAVATASGQIQVSFPSLTSAMPMLEANKYRPLAVTGLKRSPYLPNVPTLDESGLKGYDIVGWFGLVGPAGTPRPIVDKLNAAIAKIAVDPEIKVSLAKQGLEAPVGPPEQLGTYMNDLAAQIARLGKETNIKLD